MPFANPRSCSAHGPQRYQGMGRGVAAFGAIAGMVLARPEAWLSRWNAHEEPQPAVRSLGVEGGNAGSAGHWAVPKIRHFACFATGSLVGLPRSHRQRRPPPEGPYGRKRNSHFMAVRRSRFSETSASPRLAFSPSEKGRCRRRRNLAKPRVFPAKSRDFYPEKGRL